MTLVSDVTNIYISFYYYMPLYTTFYFVDVDDILII